MQGSFVISLDFELHWGGAEKWNLPEKRQYFLNTREIILELLDVFEENDISVTWATVGFLFSSSIEESNKYFPLKKPNYHNQSLNYYKLFEDGEVGQNENEDPFHFASNLIDKIIKTKGQELASHTFCHYYCNEEGQTNEEFDFDLNATQKIAKDKFNTSLKSLVFPRNQFNDNYTDTVAKNGYKIIRTNPDVWFWRSSSKLMFLARALDTIMPISKRVSYQEEKIIRKNKLIYLPASRFFRPFNNKEILLQRFKMYRIKKEMTKAAQNGEVYHLWWHPHNFGSCSQENMSQLKEIINHYKYLNKKFNFKSKNMGDFV